jgi:hypothetical protein
MRWAERDPADPERWESYLFAGSNERIFVVAKTDPDNWSSWGQIQWQVFGGERVTGVGNAWRFPRDVLRDYEITASLGGVTRKMTLSVTTLVDLTSPDGSHGARGSPVKPIGTGLKINIYGEHETDRLGFKDYAVNKEWQNPGGPTNPPKDSRDIRPLTRAPITARPPLGPGLADGSASDICIHSAPFNSPVYYAIHRIRSKFRCRITYQSASESEIEAFLAAFPDACHLQHWRTKTEGSNGTPVEVIEYPARSAWSAVSDGAKAVVPRPDPGTYEPKKIRRTEEDGLT